MITKAELKYYSSLLKKNFRDEYGKFLVEGEKLILEAIDSQWKCETTLCTRDYYEQNEKSIESLSVKVSRIEIISAKDFQKVQSTVSSQGIVGVFEMKTKLTLKGFKGDLIIALENLNDPGNVGSIMRNADWFGVKEIFLSENCADIFNPKTIRASGGSVFHLKTISDVKLIDELTSFKMNGYTILCADITGTNIYEYQKNKKEIIVFSNEANGPTNELLQIADENVSVPKKGKAESLNVASASAVILSELTKTN